MTMITHKKRLQKVPFILAVLSWQMSGTLNIKLKEKYYKYESLKIFIVMKLQQNNKIISISPRVAYWDAALARNCHGKQKEKRALWNVLVVLISQYVYHIICFVKRWYLICYW